MSIVIETYAGDGAPTITLPLTRRDGSVVTLTGATVRLVIMDPSTGLPTNNANNLCTITDAAGGICTYSWAITGTDCPNPGIYKAYLKVRTSNTAEETYALLISASADNTYGALLS